MATLDLPTGEQITVNRASRFRSPDYELVVQFQTPDTQDGHFSQSRMALGPLVETDVSGRADVTVAVIEEAFAAWYDRVGADRGITSIIEVKVEERMTIRHRPYEEKYGDDEDA